jgi:3-isopropylmalate/(R)-2-methylmalate dehydratase large subunit
MGKTIAEKILSNKSGKDAYAGEIVIADLDFVMAQDGTAPLAIKVLGDMGIDKVFDREKVALVIDHSSPSPNEGVSALHKIMRDFAAKQEVKLYDVGCGVCHQLIPEDGNVVPGNLMVGADSHTCTYGAINVFSTGVGSTDAAAAMAAGQLWFKIPPTIKFNVNGKLNDGVFSKDIALEIIRTVTADGCTYMAAEVWGNTIEDLSVDARLTISNMGVEMGAKACLMPADSKVIDWVKDKTGKTFEPVAADEDAKYEKIINIDASSIEPLVAVPHGVDTAVTANELNDTPVKQGFIGTCTNGRYEDLEIAAKMLKGKQIKNDFRLIIAPASKAIFLKAVNSGVVADLITAGAVFVTPGCGPCVGTHNGVPSDGENVISTANRNFKGRMGNSNAFIYLSSPATVAASALTGKITDPRNI